ncbi:MAG: hypothetical protein IJR05_11680 [Acidaminococcaceae bacterium]|nr:hypothetical protein [Acidaminococcaceae bacterium]
MKINLEVNAKFDLDGTVRPTSIIWEDGRVFTVDRVLDVRRAASLKAGGVGVRYICRICGKIVMLWNEEGKWFMEK